jgi:cytochrome c-type biogenesis protein CcmE
MTRKRRRLYVVGLGMLGLFAAAALVLTAFEENLVFFYSPSDLAEKTLPPGRPVRLGGLVEEGSIERRDGLTVHFRVTDLSQSTPVVYQGLLPDLFREGQGVVTEGTLGPDGVFVVRPVAARERSLTVIPELGHFALILALAVALVQGSLPMVGAARGNVRWMALAGPAAFLQFALVATAFLALMQAYVSSDFTVLNVVRNSHSAKPMLYKVSGVWGNHEGSMVLWVLILTLFGAAVAGFGANLPPTLRTRVLGVQAWISIGFLVFLLFTSNPFERVFPPPTPSSGCSRRPWTAGT